MALFLFYGAVILRVKDLHYRQNYYQDVNRLPKILHFSHMPGVEEQINICKAVMNLLPKRANFNRFLTKPQPLLSS